jgi:hypothetical protein
MASIAFDSFVPTIQLEAGALVMVEVPDLPISGVVTVRTACTEPLSVYVILFVARIAGRRCLILVEVSCMATLAGGGSVFTPQRILRIVVVLKEEHFPIPFGVTAFTVLGKLPLMLVVFFVTGKAIDRRLVLI